MSIQELDFTTCDLFSILDSLNYSREDINGLTPAIFRNGELSRISLSRPADPLGGNLDQPACELYHGSPLLYAADCPA